MSLRLSGRFCSFSTLFLSRSRSWSVPESFPRPVDVPKAAPMLTLGCFVGLVTSPALGPFLAGLWSLRWSGLHHVFSLALRLRCRTLVPLAFGHLSLPCYRCGATLDILWLYKIEPFWHTQDTFDVVWSILVDLHVSTSGCLC